MDQTKMETAEKLFMSCQFDKAFPILEELAKEYDGKIDIYKVDTEKEQELAAVFGIRSIPTLLFCPTDGRPQVAQGAMSKADFEKAIDELLLKKQ